ncbi:hypothetical protein [Pigmentiphaga kullae]|uniref:hypothetical protein n=1 Tax=Pigmentiphaga kullae TaxID=151784 RepID=UPI00102CA042|nr:hypothetical protein [Pigmentiphaga kullae]
MKIPLDLTFKGNRHYIQGGDLFNSAEAVIQAFFKSEKAYINRLSFTRFAYNQCDLLIGDIPSPEEKIGEGSLTLPDGETRLFYLCEKSTKLLERRPYDEESMVAPATYEDRSAMLLAPLPYTSIEAVIALTKVLSYRLNEPAQGKWVFGKIDLQQKLPAIRENLTIRQVKALPGRFSVNDVVIDNIRVAQIHFIVGAP